MAFFFTLFPLFIVGFIPLIRQKERKKEREQELSNGLELGPV